MQLPLIKPLLAALALTLAYPVFAQTTTAPADADAAGGLKSRKDVISYAVGVTTARNLMKDGVDIDPAIVFKGMQDAMGGGRTVISERDIRSAMNGLVGEMRQKMALNRKDLEENNRKKGDEYRTALAKQPGVVKLPSGVLYKSAVEGKGAKPGDTDSVLVNYKGTLISGVEFDGNADGKPVTLKVDQLILGWKEALKLMPTGSRWTIVIPPQMAYGARGVGSDIGPNETLVFDVELVAIVK
jgi:FKBP-type peptidyl-prolyl cis-trans isomerase FklB